ncbi:bifunctional alpha/beta hydrolase/OsmC family protein [Aquipuribacter sp. SD81]|uniref:bifunctional alpha/beta hydrolase/OsmC family protein n=1 Tax=Aquipuribacter sp. SD81 TaxID=3127703 RepID=UPI003019568D
MAREQVDVQGAHGQTLSGVLELPDGPVRSWAVFAHCFTCSKDSHAATRISRGLAERGTGVLRYDFTGLGESDGEFADATFSGDVADLVAAATWLGERRGEVSLLVGHSLGGAAVLAAAPRLASVRAVATIAAPADPEHVTRLLAADSEELRAEGSACVRIAGREFRVRQGLVDDLRDQRLLEGVGDLDAALLVLHSPLDEEVGVDNAARIFAAARHPRSYVSLDDADHLLSRREDSLYAADVISAWASRYVPVTPPQRTVSGTSTASAPSEGTTGRPGAAPADPAKATSAGEVVVTETGEGPFAQEVRAGRHVWTLDEPPDVPGGTDTGPTPYDQLLAGLGACTAMTLRMYADRKKWPLRKVTVRLTQEHRHGDDATACVAGQDGCAREFDRVVDVEGDLDEEQRGRLLEIADKCPVHRTLEQGVTVRTSLA